MINRKWKEEFEKFLNDKNIYDLFYHNYKDENINFCIDIFDETNYIDDYISNAFDWNFTDEGYNFWSDIDDKWVEYCDYNELEKYDILTK